MSGRSPGASNRSESPSRKWLNNGGSVRRGASLPSPAPRRSGKRRGEVRGDMPKSLGEHPELAFARARPAPDERDLAIAVIGSKASRLDPGTFKDSRLQRHRRNEGEAKAVVDHLHERVERSSHHRRMRSQFRPVAGRKRMVLEAMAVLEK